MRCRRPFRGCWWLSNGIRNSRRSQAFRDLQVQLEGTENRIAVERNRYNEAARGFNTARRQFPAVLIAGFLGFGEKGYFESKPGADEPPEVEF